MAENYKEQCIQIWNAYDKADRASRNRVKKLDYRLAEPDLSLTNGIGELLIRLLGPKRFLDVGWRRVLVMASKVHHAEGGMPLGTSLGRKKPPFRSNAFDRLVVGTPTSFSRLCLMVKQAGYVTVDFRSCGPQMLFWDRREGRHYENRERLLADFLTSFEWVTNEDSGSKAA